MTIDQATRLSREYQRVLIEEDKRGGRRNPALLPAPKDLILIAIKLEIAQLFYIQAETNEKVLKPLVDAAMFIDSFNDVPQDAGTYIRSMQQRRHEMDNYVLELLKIDRSHPFYWQRIYSLLGIASETKTTSFFEGLKQRLRRGPRAGEDTYTFRNPVGRLKID